MRPTSLRRHLVATAAALACLAPLVSAHGGFGGAVETRFAFPSWVVWAAGGLVVALSFAIVGGFLTRSVDPDLLRPSPLRVVAVARRLPLGWTPGRVIGTVVLALVALNAFHPGSDSVLPEVALWVTAWTLLAVVAYTVGDVWPYVSPFHGLAAFAESARGSRDPKRWPRMLGMWPATVLFVALVGLEVIDVAWMERPSALATLILAYTLLTIVGMAVFGGEVWLTQAEVVTATMRWWAAASPLTWYQGRPQWRGFAASLAALRVRDAAQVAFTVSMLYGVNFDGFLVTPWGRAAVAALDGAGTAWAHLVLLLAGLALFMGVWYAAAHFIRRTSETLRPVHDLAAVFAASLLPIAVGYHLSHNAFTLVEQVPLFVYAVVDPLGFSGWPDAFLHLPLTWSVWGAWGGTVGTVQVLLVLVGHLVAVLVAHRLAERTFPSRIMALRAEVPLTVVMVVYTWIGLWVLVSAGGGAA